MIKSKKRLTILLSVAMAAALSLTTLSAVPFGAKADDTYATISEEMKNELRQYTSADDFMISTWVGFYNADIKSTYDQLVALEEAGHTLVLNTDFQLTDIRTTSGYVSNDYEFWKSLDGYANDLNMNYFYRLPYDRGTDTFDADLANSLTLSERCIGYQMGDEPNASLMPTVYAHGRKIAQAQTGRTDKLFVNLFPSYAGSTNLGGSYEDYVSGFVDGVGAENINYLSFDHYPFRNGSDSSEYFSDMEVVRKVAYENGNLRTLAMPQTCTWGAMRETTRGEERWNVYSYLAYGVKALSSFCWVCPGDSDNGGEGFREGVVYRDGTVRNQEKSDFQSNLNWEVRSMGRVLMNLDTVHAYHTLGNVQGVETLPASYIMKPVASDTDFILSYMEAKENSGTSDHIMLFNKSYTQSKTVSFEISQYSGIEGLEYYNPYTGEYEDVDISGGVLTDTFLAGEGKLYRLKGNVNTDLSVEAPQITRAGGIFASGLTTTITAAADAEIYYTIDGSFPTVNSVRYNGETLRFGGEGAKSYLLRAVAYKNGVYSDVTEEQYFIMPDGVATFEVDDTKWKATGGGTWSVQDGVYKQTGTPSDWNPSYTYTAETFGNFWIEADLKIASDTSGGGYVGFGLRKTRIDSVQDNYMQGFYVGIDTDGVVFLYTGAGSAQSTQVVREAPSGISLKNGVKLAVLCYDKNIYGYVNGSLIFSYSDVNFDLGAGYVSLQSCAIKTDFSNLRIIDMDDGAFNVGEREEAITGALYDTKMAVDKFTLYNDVIAMLPKTVSAIDTAGYAHELAVTWSCSDYDKNTEGAYFFTGILELPASGKLLNLYDIQPKLIVSVNYLNNYVEINRLIALAESLDEEEFTAESWAKMYSLYLAAKEIAMDKSLSQNAVDVGSFQLEDAINALERAGIIKTVLNAQLERARAVVASEYTAASYEVLKNAISYAEQVLATGLSTQEELDGAANMLANARTALKKLGNISALNNAIASAEQANIAGKTASSVKNLQDAIAYAKALAEKQDVSQEEVETAVAELEAAVSGLRVQSEPVTPTEKSGCGSSLSGTSSLMLAVILISFGIVFVKVRRKG